MEKAEQPYPIPDNWRWVQVGSVSTLQRGVSYTKNDAHAVKKEDDVLILRGGNIGEGYITTDNDCVYVNKSLINPYQIVKEHDIIIVSSTGSKTVIGRAGISHENYTDVAFGAFLFLVRPAKTVNPQYLGYYFLSVNYRNRIRNLSKGININNIRGDYITKSPIPLPPLAEQERIVERIESLFSALDDVRRKVRAALDGLELWKTALLHEAFSGKLTAEWRELHPDAGIWVKKPLKDCGEWRGGGTPSMAHPEYWENGDLLWITPKDMKSDLIEDTLLHINRLAVENSSANYIEKPSVLFVMRSGILRRVLPIAVVKTPFTVNQDLKALSPHDDIDPDYLFWACRSCEKAILNACMKNGTTVESINTWALTAFEIPIAPKEEQLVIAACLGRWFKRQKAVAEAAEEVLRQIDMMKTVILGRAFRGELGTNRPDEEPVSLG